MEKLPIYRKEDECAACHGGFLVTEDDLRFDQEVANYNAEMDELGGGVSPDPELFWTCPDCGNKNDFVDSFGLPNRLIRKAGRLFEFEKAKTQAGPTL